MTQQLERSRHTERLRQFLTTADKIVWSNSSFPQSHRPDVATLAPTIQIGMPQDSGFIPHPRIKRELRKQLLEQLEASIDPMRTHKIAWHDPETRSLTFSDAVMMGPDPLVKRIVYHEAATDVVNQPVQIQPETYTEEQRNLAKEIIRLAFHKKDRPWVNQTWIRKTGFREVLMTDEHSISDMFFDERIYADEIYPTTHEIITEQIMKLQGNIERFDELAQNGKLVQAPHEDHPLFSEALFQTIQTIDWRDILEAYKTGTVSGTIGYLAGVISDTDQARAIYDNLAKAMEADETEAVQAIDELRNG